MRSPLLVAAAILIAGSVAVVPNPAHAQSEKPAPAAAARATGAQPSAPARAADDPASGLPELGTAPLAVTDEQLAIGVWPERPYPGGLIVVDVAGARAIASARGKLRGAKVRFHRLDAHTLRGFAPLPDDARAGEAALELRVTFEEKRKKTVTRRLALQVREAAFDEDALKVDSRFTKLSKKARKTIAADRTLLSKMWKKGSAEKPLFTENFLLPRKDRTTAPYGTRRTFNGDVRSVHRGWDLDGDIGDPVACANDGVVTLASDLYYSGGTLFLDHGGGLYTGYFHLDEIVVKVGERVKRGQLCGKIGKTGRVTGPHLHWAAKLGGHYLHPATLLLFDFRRPLVRPPAAPIVAGEVP